MRRPRRFRHAISRSSAVIFLAEQAAASSPSRSRLIGPFCATPRFPICCGTDADQTSNAPGNGKSATPQDGAYSGWRDALVAPRHRILNHHDVHAIHRLPRDAVAARLDGDSVSASSVQAPCPWRRDCSHTETVPVSSTMRGQIQCFMELALGDGAVAEEQTVIALCRWSFVGQASPTASGSPPPRSLVPRRIPWASKMCIDPPRPRLEPVCLP